MDEIFDLRALVSELTKDNREMLETIESLQESLEKASRENEQLRKRIIERERPSFPPTASGMLPDDWFRKMHEPTGLRGGKRP